MSACPCATNVSVPVMLTLTMFGAELWYVVAGSWLRTWAAGRRSGDAAFAAGMLAGIERAAADDARRRWRKVWKRTVAARGAI